MKVTLNGLLALVSVLFATQSQAHASAELVSCVSTRDSAQELVAVIVDQELRAVRFQIPNSFPRQYPVTKLGAQESPGQTIYSLTFTNFLIIADNTLLTDLTGQLVIDGQTWACN